MTTTRFVSLVSAAACLVLASACKSTEGVVNPYVAIAGSYTLLTANGELPLRFLHTDAGTGQLLTVDLVSGTLSLAATGTFHEGLQYHVTPPAPAAPYDPELATTDGTYTVNGSTITFTYVPSSNGQPYSWGGTVGTGTLTYTDPIFTDLAGGLTAVYTK